MIDWLLQLGAGILVIGAYLLLWGWVPITLLFLPDFFEFRCKMPHDRAITASRIVCVVGGIALWVVYRYLLPYPFVRAVTSLVS